MFFKHLNNKMVNFMLSFTDGQPIAQVYDNKGKVVHTIRVKRENKDGPPDITTDNIFDILTSEDVDKISKISNLSTIERKILMKAIKEDKPERLNTKLRNAFMLTVDLLEDKLKKELEFEDDLYVLPMIGQKNTPFDRHVFIVGASESGKSVMAGKILKNDVRKRPIVLFSKCEDDPAFDGLLEDSDEDNPYGGNINDSKKRKSKKKRMKHFKLGEEESILEIPPKEDLTGPNGVVLLFDDIHTFSPEVSDFLVRYQNDALETGRKSGISVISTCHELATRGSKTKCNLNEAEWIILFPHTNQMLSTKFLRDRMGILKKDRDNILNKASKNRFMAIKTSTPMCAIHEKGIILI